VISQFRNHILCVRFGLGRPDFRLRAFILGIRSAVGREARGNVIQQFLLLQWRQRVYLLLYLTNCFHEPTPLNGPIQ
jgi:hypothetical protein